MKYFHCNCILLKSIEVVDNNRDSLFSFTFNPFALQANIGHKGLDKPLKKIAQSFNKRLVGDTGLSILINAYPLATMQSQAQRNSLVGNVRRYLVEKMKVRTDKITTNVEPGSGDPNILDILFTKTY